MPSTATLEDVDVSPLTPFEGDISPVPFGVEHEFNGFPGGTPTLRRGWSQHGEHCGWEIKTGIETNIPEVMAEWRRLEALSSGGHNNCGLHVHVNATPSIGGAIHPTRLFQIYQATKGRDLYPNIPGQTRQQRQRWAQEIDQSVTPEQFLSLGRQELAPSQLWGRGTIEIRLGGGTHDMDHMERWIRTLVTLAVRSQYRAGEEPIKVFGPLLRPSQRNPIEPNRNSHQYQALTGRYGYTEAQVLRTFRAANRIRDINGRFCSAETYVAQRDERRERETLEIIRLILDQEARQADLIRTDTNSYRRQLRRENPRAAARNDLNYGELQW